MNIQGHSAIVAGGGSGLGEAVARALAAAGAKVAVQGINEAGAQRVASEMRGTACRCDVTDTASVSAALDAAGAAHGVPRIVMNIAGIGSAKRIIARDGSSAPLEDVERVLPVNLIGTDNVCRPVGHAGGGAPLPQAPGPARGACLAGAGDRAQHPPQWRGDPARRRAAHGAALRFAA